MTNKRLFCSSFSAKTSGTRGSKHTVVGALGVIARLYSNPIRTWRAVKDHGPLIQSVAPVRPAVDVVEIGVGVVALGAVVVRNVRVANFRGSFTQCGSDFQNVLNRTASRRSFRHGGSAFRTTSAGFEGCFAFRDVRATVFINGVGRLDFLGA